MPSLEPLDLRHLARERVIGCYVVETSDGPALFDCGPATCVPELKARLAERGLELSDLRHLLLSHIHLDHAGAAGTLVREHPELQVPVSEIRGPPPIAPAPHHVCYLTDEGTLYAGDATGVRIPPSPAILPPTPPPEFDLEAWQKT